MKQNKSVFSMVFLFCLLTAFTMQAQTFEKSKQISRSFALGNDSEVEVSNKYGNINIVPWEKDSVKFQINLSVKGSKQSKVDKTFGLIDFEFESTPYYIIVKTDFQGNSFWNDVSDIGSSVFGSNTKTKIDYTIYLPATAKLKIVNKYGNIYAADHKGDLSVNLSNGDLKAHDLMGNVSITTEFGNCDIKQIKTGTLNISYGELYLDKSHNLTLTGKSSTFHMGIAGIININSKRDKIFINSADVIKGTFYFSRLEPDSINEVLDCSAKYGDINIKKLGDDCRFFKLKTNATDVVLHFTDQKQYNLSILTNKETKVYYSSSIKNINSKNIDRDDKMINIECVIGNNNRQNIPLSIECMGGSLSLSKK